MKPTYKELEEQNKRLKQFLGQADDIAWRVSDESVPLFSSDRLKNLHKQCSHFIHALRRSGLIEFKPTGQAKTEY